MTIRSFTQAAGFLNRFTDYERMTGVRATPRTYNLKRTRALLEAVGNPQNSFDSIHIAGTKGKGSTAHMLETILRTEGRRTGLYTSPHLLQMLERIRIDGRPVPERDFAWAMNRLESTSRRLRPTYFEIMTAAAFLLFKRSRVDTAVVEAGLGGRLDATNVLTPMACAITTIDFDHTEILGRTLAKIAGEKAGILKPGIPAVTTQRQPPALCVIERAARRGGSRLLRLGHEIRIKNVQASSVGQPPMVQCDVTIGTERTLRLRMPVYGPHQAENAAAAAALARMAGVRRAVIERAFPKVRLPGRLEVVSRRPWVVVDSAHNPVSIRAAARVLRRPPGGRVILVFGTSREKDVREMLETLRPKVDLALFTRSQSPRALAPADLAGRWRAPALCIGSVARAVGLARKIARPMDVLLVTGSFYVAGEALAALGHEARR